MLRSGYREEGACRRRNTKRVVHSIKYSRVREEVASHVGSHAKWYFKNRTNLVEKLLNCPRSICDLRFQKMSTTNPRGVTLLPTSKGPAPQSLWYTSQVGPYRSGAVVSDMLEFATFILMIKSIEAIWKF